MRSILDLAWADCGERFLCYATGDGRILALARSCCYWNFIPCCEIASSSGPVSLSSPLCFVSFNVRAGALMHDLFDALADIPWYSNFHMQRALLLTRIMKENLTPSNCDHVNILHSHEPRTCDILVHDTKIYDPVIKSSELAIHYPCLHKNSAPNCIRKEYLSNFMRCVSIPCHPLRF